jgi:HK97 family phage major capsid protein
VTLALSLKVDLGIFEGSGTEHAVLGLKNRPGILGDTLGTDGAEIADLDPFIEALAALEAANARPSGWVMAPRTWGDLMKLRDQVDSIRPLLGEAYGVSGTSGISRRLLGLPVHASSQLSVTEAEGSSGAVCSSVYVAQWDQVLLCRDEKQEVYLDVDQGETFSRDQAQIRGLMRVDLATPNPEAIFRIRGIKPTT